MRTWRLGCALLAIGSATVAAAVAWNTVQSASLLFPGTVPYTAGVALTWAVAAGGFAVLGLRAASRTWTRIAWGVLPLSTAVATILQLLDFGFLRGYLASRGEAVVPGDGALLSVLLYGLLPVVGMCMLGWASLRSLDGGSSAVVRTVGSAGAVLFTIAQALQSYPVLLALFAIEESLGAVSFLPPYATTLGLVAFGSLILIAGGLVWVGFPPGAGGLGNPHGPNAPQPSET